MKAATSRRDHKFRESTNQHLELERTPGKHQTPTLHVTNDESNAQRD